MSSNLDNFVGLSSALIGISADRLAPQIDPVGLPPIFLDYVTARVPSDVLSALLSQYATLVAEHLPPDQIAQQILKFNMQPTIPRTVLTARSIMKLWLLGVWYQPFDMAPFKKDDSAVVSDQAYIHSWAWKIAQAHPMGYSESFFGYWNSAPSSLEDLTGVSANGQQGALS
ncbi:sorbitol dehydrogenase [Pseudomonas brassicacearum]|uniref:sorbitol dehydrogenase n=1 Tax=Pseudomonas brassicacearum TaxID=930166 RepID=UPI0034664B71